jgi:hypothetical protein
MFVRPATESRSGQQRMKILDRFQRGNLLVDIVFNDAGEVEVNIYPEVSSAEHREVVDYLIDEGLLARANENASICRGAGT